MRKAKKRESVDSAENDLGFETDVKLHALTLLSMWRDTEPKTIKSNGEKSPNPARGLNCISDTLQAVNGSHTLCPCLALKSLKPVQNGHCSKRFSAQDLGLPLQPLSTRWWWVCSAVCTPRCRLTPEDLGRRV